MTNKTGSIKIMIGKQVVGAIQALEYNTCCPIAISSSRQIIERNVYPRISASRVRFDRLRLTEAFSRGFVNCKSQLYPVQIEAENSEEICEIKNAWITSQDYSYTTDDWIIADAMEFDAEKIIETKK